MSARDVPPAPLRALLFTFIFFIAVASSTAQPLKIDRFTIEANDGRPRFEFTARPDSYYILLRGTIDNVIFAADMEVDAGTSGVLVDPRPIHSSASMFYRILQVPIAAPLDIDHDGIDDVYELRSGGRLSPLNSADALQISST